MSLDQSHFSSHCHLASSGSSRDRTTPSYLYDMVNSEHDQSSVTSALVSVTLTATDDSRAQDDKTGWPWTWLTT